MGSMFSTGNCKIKMSRQETDNDKVLSKAKALASSAPVVVFSKTHCGFCNRVKQLLTELGSTFKVIELDEEADGQEIQSALHKWTGLRTVPNVFIGGKHIGGCDSTLAKYQQGELLTLLINAGAVTNKSAHSEQSG